MKKKRFYFAAFALWLAIVNCSMPSGAATESPESSGVELTMTALSVSTVPVSTAISSLTPETVATIAASPTSCVGTVVANTNINVRSGPGTVYDAIGSIPQNGSAQVDGKSADGTWWYIVFPSGVGGHGWVSGSVVNATCIPTTLAIIAAPPTPLPASGSCKDGYVHRLIIPSDKVCVPPASKAQADADNAADSSRKLVTAYGANACKVGYVWRDAYTGDVVCVTSDVRAQAAADNAAAASRWTAGAYGPHTCIAGFVWREATAGDDVCVTPDVHAQTAADNAAASSRYAGANDCISGYVWREAFSGDKVCVTPAVKSQVAADNAAAPSHTWP